MIFLSREDGAEQNRREQRLMASVVYEIGLRHHRLRCYCQQLKQEHEALLLRQVNPTSYTPGASPHVNSRPYCSCVAWRSERFSVLLQAVRFTAFGTAGRFELLSFQTSGRGGAEC